MLNKNNIFLVNHWTDLFFYQHFSIIESDILIFILICLYFDLIFCAKLSK